MFEDRKDAGQRLAGKLRKYKNEKPIILALPRGGVPVGYEIARVLDASLDVLVARKLGAPYNPEFGIGAIAEGNTQVLDKKTIKELGITEEEIEDIAREARKELARRAELYRDGKSLPSVRNRTVIIVDDGLATGVTAQAAIASVRKQKPKQIIFASPVCAHESARELTNLVDKVICAATSVDFAAVGLWYRNFVQVSDREVVELLKQSRFLHSTRRSKIKESSAGTKPPRDGKSAIRVRHAEPKNYMHYR